MNTAWISTPPVLKVLILVDQTVEIMSTDFDMVTHRLWVEVQNISGQVIRLYLQI